MVPRIPNQAMSRCLLLLGCLLSVSHAFLAEARPMPTMGTRIRFDTSQQKISSNAFLPQKKRFTASSSALVLRGGASPGSVAAFLNAMDLLGTAVFAFSGARTAGKKGMDVLGMLIIATITSVGGGTVRDLLLGSGTVFWMKDPIYLQICAVTTIATFLLWPTLEEKMDWKGSEVPVCTADAIGLAAFAVLGTQKAARMGELHPIMWVVSGLMSACFGGIIRDTLCLQRPRVMYPERTMYGPAPLIGSAIYALLSQYVGGLETQNIATVSFITTFILRVFAFNNPMRLPHWKQTVG